VCLLRGRNYIFISYSTSIAHIKALTCPIALHSYVASRVPRQLGCYGRTYVTKAACLPSEQTAELPEFLEESKGHLAWNTTPELIETTEDSVTVINIVPW
jgi:hypothetical protein